MKRGFWRTCRIYFRRFRITVWFIVLLLLSALIYLNQVGLPGFIKRPLLERLHARGLDLQFSRLRLRWYQGIVAENVRFGAADRVGSPQLTLDEVRVLLNFKAFAHLQLQVKSLALRRGRLVWPLGDTNQPPRALTLDQIQTDLRFLPDDQWALDNFQAEFAGARIRLSGLVTNASAVREWKVFQPGAQPALAPNAWLERLRRFADTLERVQFPAPPVLRLDLRGDARDLQSFGLLLLLDAPGADTPWGNISGGHFIGRLFPANTNGASRADFTLEATQAITPWAAITNLQLAIHLASLPGQSNLVQGDLTLSAAEAHTEWCTGTQPVLTARWLHSTTNPVPLSGHGQFECLDAQSRWADVGQVQFRADFARLAEADLAATDATWGWWTNLQPYQLSWETTLGDVQTPKLAIEQIAGAGQWQPPTLVVTNLQADLYGRQFGLDAALDVATRVLQGRVTSDLDLHRLKRLLPGSSLPWLDELLWEQPPRLEAALSLVVPAWTNAHPDWRAEVQPSVVLQGEASLERGVAFRGVEVNQIHTHFLYSNLCLHLPDLTVTRPESRLTAEYRGDDRTGEFFWGFAGTLAPDRLRPLMEPDVQGALDLFVLSQPPVFQAELRGNYHDLNRLGVAGQVALTNFSFRGEFISGLQTSLRYTNRCLELLAPRLQRGTQRMSADGLLADFNAQLVYLTNGYSTVEPLVIARAIGAHIARAIQPYEFLQPPSAQVYGTIPMRGEEGADLHFDLDGGPFRWWKFDLPHVTSHVHWAGLYLTLTNVSADFYKGQATGWAAFDFTPKATTAFQFALVTTNTLLQDLMADLSTTRTHLEGRLSGKLLVTHATTEDWRTVEGNGDLTLRDGLVWDLPVFGVFSPVLNAMAPGLGTLRATSGGCTFAITNGVLRSDNLEIRSPAFRLLYRGVVDLEGKVNSKVEAELLRDVWLVGPIMSTVLVPVSKLFEYRVTGTLEQPKPHAVYLVPNLVLLPFHPFRLLKNLMPDDSSRTNAPDSRLFEDLDLPGPH